MRAPDAERGPRQGPVQSAHHDHEHPQHTPTPYSCTTPTLIQRGQYPAVDRLVTKAVRHLGRHVPHVCRHGGPYFVCAQHPAAGVLCPDCLQGHVERHRHDVEHGCDACGTVDDPDGLFVFIAALHGVLPTRNPRRGPALLAGQVRVVGIGLCPACAGLEAVKR